MKKTYIAPTSSAIEMFAEQMLATSIDINDTNDSVTGGDSFSNQKFWGERSKTSIWKNY